VFAESLKGGGLLSVLGYKTGAGKQEYAFGKSTIRSSTTYLEPFSFGHGLHWFVRIFTTHRVEPYSIRDRPQ